MLFGSNKNRLPTPGEALPGRPKRQFKVPDRHTVLGNPLIGPYPVSLEVADFALGCFWGAERTFWRTEGVWTTVVGYQGGHTPNPTYEEVCSGRTGQTEAVRVVYDPTKTTFTDLLKVFWETHDPTQGMRQGNDLGSQYRSAIYYTTDAQRAEAERTRDLYAPAIKPLGYGDITTEIAPAQTFYYAEDYHQQYLHKNPNGYRCHSNTGAKFPA